MQDIRYAIRTMLAAPLVSALALLCLALGVGSNATMFSVLDAVLIRPLPFRDPDHLIILTEANARAGATDALMSYPNFRDVREETRTVAAMTAYASRSITLADREEPIRLDGTAISWNTFDMIGVRPALGRSFREDEDRRGSPGAVILGDDVWRTRYQADPSIVGRTIMVNDAPHTVVGVMPPRFAFPFRSQAWVTIEPIVYADPRSERALRVYARMADGATTHQVRDEMRAIGGRLAERYAENRGWNVEAKPIAQDFIPEQVEVVVLAAMAAVSLVLLIACANVANLLLARAASRQREIAVRTAVGASRGRILRQLLTESLVLAVTAAPFGIALAFVGVRLVDAGIPDRTQIPYYLEWTVNARVLLYVLAVALGTGALFGLAPALQTLRTNLVESLKDGGRGGGIGAQRGRLRAALVVSEVALSLILLVGALLFVRSFLNLQNASAGFDTGPLVMMRFYMPGDRYEPPPVMAQRIEDIVRRIEAAPGVASATASNYVPLNGGGAVGRAAIDGKPAAPGEEPRIAWAAVAPHFLRTLGVGLLRGRDFTDAEGFTLSRVAVINATMAARFWPGDDPVGRRFRLHDERDGDWFTVIGVMPDVARGFVGSRPFPYALVPLPFQPMRNTGLVVRASAGDATSLVSTLREQIRASDASLPVFTVQTMEEARQRGYWQYRMFSWMFSIFGGIALALAAVGVYGVLAYSVSQRAHEIGVRMALGARGADVVRMVAGQGCRLAGLGVIVGTIGALGVTQGLRTILFNVSASDPLTYAVVALFLVSVAMAAAWVPARRATRVDPITALRAE